LKCWYDNVVQDISVDDLEILNYAVWAKGLRIQIFGVSVHLIAVDFNSMEKQ
jgi:hypothetical protein